MVLEFSWQIFKKYWNIKFHEYWSSGTHVVPCRQTQKTDIQTDWLIEMTKLIDTFCNFADVQSLGMDSTPLYYKLSIFKGKWRDGLWLIKKGRLLNKLWQHCMCVKEFVFKWHLQRYPNLFLTQFYIIKCIVNSTSNCTPYTFYWDCLHFLSLWVIWYYIAKMF